ncbi:hypothetical protein [Serratia liquefaciens]|uniref:hypothetical protein n=1 Tax=Serratia liquefaciens TaxID=614 RepID=UPI0022B96687|nr:hypothetical protein [Serratia liquefaciens]
MSINNDSITLNISVDTLQLDKLEAQLERIAELCERINASGQFGTGFVVPTSKVFIKSVTINSAELTCGRDPELSLATEACVKAVSDDIARSSLDAALKLVVTNTEREAKLQGVDDRFSRIESNISQCQADIAKLLFSQPPRPGGKHGGHL